MAEGGDFERRTYQSDSSNPYLKAINTDSPAPGSVRLFDQSQYYESQSDSDTNRPYQCPSLGRMAGATRNAIVTVGYSATAAGLYSRSLTRACTYFGWIVKGQEKSSPLFIINTVWSYLFLFPSYIRGYWPLIEKFLGKEITFQAQRDWQKLETKQQRAKFILSMYTALIKTTVGTYDTYELMEDLSGHQEKFIPLSATMTSVLGSSALTCNLALLVGKQIKRTSTDNPYLKFIVRDMYVDTPELGNELLDLIFPTQESELSTGQKWFARIMTGLYSSQNAILYSEGMGSLIERVATGGGLTSATMTYDSWLFYVMLITVFGPMTVGNYAGNHPLIVNYTNHLLNGDENLGRAQKVAAFFKRLVRYGEGGKEMTFNAFALAAALEKFLSTSASFAKFGVRISGAKDWNSASVGVKAATLAFDVPTSIGTGYLALSLFSQPNQGVTVPFIESINLDTAERINAFNDRTSLVRARRPQQRVDGDDLEMQTSDDFSRALL